jgi:predicted GIY-YIG superfamily endonuclease
MVYLLHFDKPISDNHTCQHYIGSTSNLEQRLKKHHAGLNGREGGARLTQVAVERGIGFEVARTWEGGREEEKRLKAQKQGPRLCPICNGAK